jgi:hypothetical protein
VADKNVYSGADVVGRTDEVNQQIAVQSVIDKTYGGIIDANKVSIKKWLGIVTRPTRATSPLGALESVKNLKFNKTMNAMSLRDGTTKYADTFVDASGNITLSKIDKFFPSSTESPSATDIDFICGQTSGNVKHIFQKPFFQGSATKINKYIDIGERLSGITIKSIGAGGGTPEVSTITVAGNNDSEESIIYTFVNGHSYNTFAIPAGSTPIQTANILVALINDGIYSYASNVGGTSPVVTITALINGDQTDIASFTTDSVQTVTPVVVAHGTGNANSATLKFAGGSTDTDYYKNWILYNSTIGNYSYISGSSYSAGDTTLNVIGNTPTSWHVGDALILYRSFHDNPTFTPSYSTVAGRPPVLLQQGNASLFSGGMGSTNGFMPIWSGYIDKTFFYGATGKGGGINYNGTYITEADIKQSLGLTVNSAVPVGSSATPLLSGRWFFCIVPETDDGIRGLPIYSSVKYFDADGTNHFVFTIDLNFATLNKRLRYLNIFLGQAPNATDTTIDWNSLFYIDRSDLLGSNWTWTETSGVTNAKYTSSLITMDSDAWNGKTQESLFTHLGDRKSVV